MKDRPIGDFVKTIRELTSINARDGIVEWMGVRPARREPVKSVQKLNILPTGPDGDHYVSGGKRSITLIQHEHLAVIGSFLGVAKVDPGLLRRNLVISGLNLLGLRNRKFSIGTAILEGSGICAPCSRMEETLGKGGYAAVRGHGGITATIVEPGVVNIGDTVSPA